MTANASPITTPAAASERSPLMRSINGGHLLAIVVLLAALAVVFFYWQGAYRRQLEAAEGDFVVDSEETAALLVQRMGSYELVTRGGVSLVASVARPSRQQWQNYVDGLNLQARFPAIVGLGFAVYARSVQLIDLQQMLRASGEGLYVVRPHGAREYYGAILYLEPRTLQNVAALGYDMYSETVRHAAMQLARDTGQAWLTGRVQLVQDSAVAPALLLYQPVYRSGDRPVSTAARRESMQGWVYVALRMQPFIDEALHNTPHRPWLRILDETDATPQLLYSDPQSDARRPPAFVHTTHVQLYGRRWRLEYRSQPLAILTAGMTGLRTTLAVGVLASLLLFVIALGLAHTRQRAQQLARRMTESYRRSELRFRSTMQYSAIGKALLDRDGRIVEANPALVSLFASTAEALVDQDFDAHFIDKPGPDAEAAASAQSQVHRITRELRRDDGEIRNVQLTYASVPGEIGQNVARLVQVEDITERLRAQTQVLALNRSLEARVQARTRELTRANDELEAFAYSVSHDLRAPLRAIDGFSRLLAERHDGSFDEAGREHLARVRNAAARMSDLIDSLLKMARLSRGGLGQEPLDLSQMAREIVAELRLSEPQRDVTVEISPELRASGDSTLVRNLMANLLSNAWKFTRGRADARIEFGLGDDEVFFVRDNGAGFPDQFANKLFRPFQRLHSQDQFAGHGIGLASVKRIVERHGGSIRAQGAPGQGATFHFTLPDLGSE